MGAAAASPEGSDVGKADLKLDLSGGSGTRGLAPKDSDHSMIRKSGLRDSMSGLA